ncbi:MAG: DUF2840 domain-containing protein [Phenylobacterium sp.]|uniref:DUF2840 domain-containing protein n=1 Tax=Phenylobacterium sp. TaxID=1871053 RepID=UPI002736ADDF|nr:DUF2840 domain-containing protein [Phenylobacterium sp.]MDP3745621.1 DUF2840 domain-containing protein [Phenylobacterium sp.]
MLEPSPAPLTDVELIWLEGRVERWIRFGRPVAERIIDRRRRVLSFAPGAVFALVHWEGGKYGTTVSRIWVLRSLRPDETGDVVQSVTPVVEVLLDLKTWAKVEAVLAAIDAVQAAGLQPATVAPDHWRHVGHRIGVAQTPSPYNRVRHRAWLMRQRLGLADDNDVPGASDA